MFERNLPAMTVIDETSHESRAFEADVAKLLNLIVHSVYSDKEVFVRELISNAADACEKLRYEAIASPDLLGDDPTLRITILIDADNKRLTVEDNGTFSVSPAALDAAPRRGTRVVLHLMDDAKSYAERFRLEGIVRTQSGHVPVPIAFVEKPGAEPAEFADGAALWAKPKSDISTADYTDFYRSLAGQLDEPDVTIHFRAEGRHEHTALAFIPGSRPFDLFDVDRKGRIKLYVKRVFITDEAEILPRYLRFVRGLVDSADLPLNISREMIQESPILTAIRKGVTSRVLGDLEKLAEKEPETYAKIWDNFGAVLKEGIYGDFERRDALLALCRFKSTGSAGAWRSLKDYVASFKANQTAIYYLVGDDIARLEASPHLEGFRARGVEVLLLADPIDSFWVTSAPSFDGRPFKSVTQGAADLALIPRLDAKQEGAPETDKAVTDFLAFIKETLGEAVSDVRASDRLTDSAVCLVAPETGLDRQLEKILAGTGRIKSAAKPILEINPRHAIVVALASLGADDLAFKQDAAHLLFDEARVLDGDRPADARMFCERLARILTRSLGKKTG